MKITVDLDCTPKELRAFMGLPDLEPIQQAVLNEMQRRMIGAMDAMTPTTIMKEWLTPMGAAQQALFGAFTQGASAAARTARNATRHAGWGTHNEPSDAEDIPTGEA